MPNLFTKVKDRARAAAQPKPRTTHQVRGQVDTPFLLLTVLLVVVGLVMLLSASYPTAYYDIKHVTDGDAFYYFKRQALFAVLGLVVMYLVSKVNYQGLRGLAVLVLVLALCGLNVFLALTVGIFSAGLVGICCGDLTIAAFAQSVWDGFTGMNEIMVLSMLIGGLGELIRYHGGIAWLLARVDGLARRLAGKSGGKGSSRVGESCIALLASLADICTANNTVAIILTGGLAREIALKNGIDPRRSASLLDIFSCVFQGLIPWAAQLLLAGSLAKISPLEITINNWYCMLLAVAGILAIILGLPRIKARSTEA